MGRSGYAYRESVHLPAQSQTGTLALSQSGFTFGCLSWCIGAVVAEPSVSEDSISRIPAAVNGKCLVMPGSGVATAFVQTFSLVVLP